jgi:hypothetical protein
MAVTIVRTPWVDDDGTGTTGTVLNNAVKTALYNDIDGALAKIPADTQATIATWVNVPFVAGNFTTPTAGATFVVTSVAVFSYVIIGKLAILTCTVAATGTTTGAPVRLQIQLPAAVTPTQINQAVPFTYMVAGIPGTGLCSFQGTKLDLLRDVNGTPFGAGTVFLYINFAFTIA